MNTTEEEVEFDYQGYMKDYTPDPDKIHWGPEARQKRREAAIHNNRGVAYAEKGDYDRAIEGYTKAIELKPAFAEAYNNRGEAWLHLGEWENARSNLTVAVVMGVNIIHGFRNEYGSVPDFEDRNGVKLPADLAAMLTPQQ